MKHLSSIVLSAAVMAAGAVACFKDPTSSLRNGPNRIELTRSAITLVTGDSLEVQAEVKDSAGNTYDAGSLQWATDNAGVATVRNDTTKSIPYGAFSKGYIVAVGPGGGVAHVTATYGNVTASVRVLNLPARLTALATAAVTGTASADTIPGSAGPPTVPAYVFSAGDTVTFTAPSGSNLTFSATGSVVHFGAATPYIVSRSTTAIKVLAPLKPFCGRPWVTNLTWTGPAEVGAIALDSLQSDSVLVARPRYRGTITQTGDTMFLAAQAGSFFSSTSVVRFGAATAVALAKDSVSFKVISPATYTGQVTVTSVKVGAATIDSLKSPTGYTINQASFGGTVVTAGGLVDIVKVYGTAITKFTTTPAGSVSNVTIGGVAAWVISRTADSMYVVAKLPSTGPISVSNVNVGGTLIPSLATAGNVVITETPTNAPDVPGVYSPGTVFIDFLTATSANPLVRFGAVDDAVNYDNYYAFTLTSARTVTIQLQFTGTGAAGDATNPDLDVYVCNATCSAWVSTAGGTSAQPENIVLTNRAAGTYNILVEGYATGGTYRPYKLIVY